MTDIKQVVDINSVDFKKGVEDGLNSAKNSTNWQAGHELGQELKNEVENKKPQSQSLFPKEPSTPLFLIDSSEGKKGNAQDEKDETEE